MPLIDLNVSGAKNDPQRDPFGMPSTPYGKGTRNHRVQGRGVAMHKFMISVAAFAALSGTPSLAAIVLPDTYEVQTPNNGVYAYQDDTYDGTNVAGYLSGGTGDLTDGVIATAHWNVTPGLWVGWADSDPTILFRFASGTVLDTIDFYFDDAMGAGAVNLPLGVALSNGTTPLAVLPAITSDGIVGRYSYNLGGLAVTNLSATLLRSNQWVMLSEVTFNGSLAAGAVPEPATWALFACGFGLIGGALRRRSLVTRTAI